MSKVDLHIHSSVSDGRFTPAEIIKKSVAAGMSLISLTDHDNVDGITPALDTAVSYPSLRVIPGLEISTDVPEGEVHMLGYFVDYTHPELLETLEKMRTSREKRAQGMIANLEKLGLPLKWERVLEIAGSGSIGRPHIAQAMLEKGYIETFKQAFTSYIGFGGPAYVTREKITPAEAMELILRSGGLPVLAHPLTFKDYETLIFELKAGGLAGLEVYYQDYDSEVINHLTGLANEYDLIVTGGSDYHGLDDNTETMIGSADMPPETADQLIVMAEQRMLKQASPR